jgi:prepilin-type N-terminal cleavage/methylation domain-containing protein
MNGRKKAVTLLELLVTVSIAGVLMTIALCSFDTMSKEQSLQTAASQIVSTYDTARYIAEKSGAQTNVILTQNSGLYSITSGQEVLSNNSRYGSLSGELPDKVKILGNNCGQIGFDINGSLVPDSNVPLVSDCGITVGYTGGISKDLTLSLATGAINND